MFYDLSLAVLAVAVAIIAWRVHRLGRVAVAPVPQGHSLPLPSPPVTAPDPAAIIPPPVAGALPTDAVAGRAADWGIFVSKLSHELRTPLSAMIRSAEMLLDSCLQPGQRQQAELIGEGGRAMLRLLSDVLDMARMEAGDLHIDARPADLRTTLDHCAAIMRPIAEARGLALTVHVAEGVPQHVTLDVPRLRQVLINLIGNAVKFTEAGTVTVDVRSTALDDGRPGLALSVTDTGAGIAPDRQQTIFQPFANADQAGRAAGGTGLGLAITRRILAAMGGDIAVRSAVDRGACFTVRLPLEEASGLPPDPAEPVGPPRAAPPPGPPSLRGRRVLLAEDHEINQQLLLAMLYSLGMEVTTATNGHDAVEAVTEAARQGRSFDLVLMDVGMPGMDGLEATARLRAAGQDAARLPVVALSASRAPDDIAAFHAAGMQAHLAKPVRIENLGRTLREVLATGEGAASRQAAVPDLRQATAASAPGVHRLESRYRKRKALLLGRIRATLDAAPESSCEADWHDIADQLHKLAGVAGNFGDERLGETARRLEQDLRAERRASARHQLLGRNWHRLAEFA